MLFTRCWKKHIKARKSQRPEGLQHLMDADTLWWAKLTYGRGSYCKMKSRRHCKSLVSHTVSWVKAPIAPAAQSSWRNPDVACYILPKTSKKKNPKWEFSTCTHGLPRTNNPILHADVEYCMRSTYTRLLPAHLFPRDIQRQLFSPSGLSQRLAIKASPKCFGETSKICFTGRWERCQSPTCKRDWSKGRCNEMLLQWTGNWEQRLGEVKTTSLPSKRDVERSWI